MGQNVLVGPEHLGLWCGKVGVLVSLGSSLDKHLHMPYLRPGDDPLRLAAWRTTHDTRWAATTYAELIDGSGPIGERHTNTLSLFLNMKNAAGLIRTVGGGIRGAAVLRQEMNALTAGLRSADLTPSGWLTLGQIAVILRSAYDPANAVILERHGQINQQLASAGPVAVNETWTHIRTDSAHHAVLWISE